MAWMANGKIVNGRHLYSGIIPLLETATKCSNVWTKVVSALLQLSQNKVKRDFKTVVCYSLLIFLKSLFEKTKGKLTWFIAYLKLPHTVALPQNDFIHVRWREFGKPVPWTMTPTLVACPVLHQWDSRPSRSRHTLFIALGQLTNCVGSKKRHIFSWLVGKWSYLSHETNMLRNEKTIARMFRPAWGGCTSHLD